MTVFGYLFAALTMYAIPEEEVWGFSWKFLYFLIPVGCATGGFKFDYYSTLR